MEPCCNTCGIVLNDETRRPSIKKSRHLRCTSCYNKKQELWRQKNKEKVAEYMRAWREKNREKTREYIREYMRENAYKYRGKYDGNNK